MKKEELVKLKKIASALLKKEDPESGISFKEDTVLSIPEVEQYNQQIYDLLDNLLEKEYKKMNWRKKKKFSLTKEQKMHIAVSDEPISISKFCYCINKVISADMRKIRGEHILDGLEDMGYLYTVEEKGNISRRPTEQGKKLGIEVVERENEYGNKYWVNLYTKDAQCFILDHLNDFFETYYLGRFM